MILGKTGVCKDVTDNNGTKGKVGKNGTLVLNFPKLKPQTFHFSKKLLGITLNS